MIRSTDLIILLPKNPNGKKNRKKEKTKTRIKIQICKKRFIFCNIIYYCKKLKTS